MAQTVIGLFDSETEAREAVEQLVNKGFTHADVDLSMQDTTHTDAESTTYRSNKDDNDGFGDSVGNFFGSLFGSSDEADRYSEVARRLKALVTVHAHSAEEAERAADILDDAGAVDVNERANQYGYSSDINTTAGTLYPESDTTLTDLPRTDADQAISVIEENLQVGKREVTTGGARLRSRIVERPVEETLRLRQERVSVDRQTVNRPATAADLANFQDAEIELTERAEVPVVNKEARVVEEISLSKEVEEREETIRDTVRKTEVDIENLSKDQVQDPTIDRDRIID